MKIKKLIKTLIISTILPYALLSAAYAEELEEVITLVVSPAFTIEKKSSSVESATMNPENGSHTGLQLVYDLNTNGTDDDYDVIVTSSIISAGGVVSGFGNDGSLLFAHETVPPTTEAVNNAKLRISNNENVIAYPVNTTITSPMTSTYYEGYKSYGSCYAIKLNDATSSTFNFMVGTNPSANTYNAARDLSGAYKSTVTFTVVPKAGS